MTRIRSQASPPPGHEAESLRVRRFFKAERSVWGMVFPTCSAGRASKAKTPEWSNNNRARRRSASQLDGGTVGQVHHVQRAIHLCRLAKKNRGPHRRGA